MSAALRAPAASIPMVSWLPQPLVCACENPNTSADRPAEIVSAPVMSSFGLCSGAWLVSSTSAPATATAANTRLTYMTARQLRAGTVVDVAGEDHPELWRRYLQIFLQGLRAAPAPPAPLEVGALAPAEVDAAMSRWRPPRR
jgi:hypothetical protein